jgi:hypothetical protein
MHVHDLTIVTNGTHSHNHGSIRKGGHVNRRAAVDTSELKPQQLAQPYKRSEAAT